MSESSAAPAKPVVMFKKAGRTRPQKSSRKRSASPTAAEEPAAETTVVRPKSRSIANPLVQGSKRRRTEGEIGGLDEYDYDADDAGITRADELATRDSNWDLESLEKKGITVNEDGNIVQADDGMYRGQKGYLPTINKTNSSRDSKMKTGPIRATANIRTITLIDYQPDICTPYKNTGFCGYGDSCKFLHDRGDYLAGWQLDKLDPADPDVQEVEEEEEMLPFACIKCQKEFKDPVVTKCGHYFCMQCALDYYKKKNKCYACGARTDGIFTLAEKLLRKLKAKQERRREEKDKFDKVGSSGIDIGDGSDVSDGEEGEESAPSDGDDE
ncbi:hypothetical protein CcaverHIS002_0108200 [Cutaneotrichosporon cavernicola]|nr:hypothetical protein CcaverHIS002_0108200 [Cutaneotrichosporon cavernicola]